MIGFSLILFIVTCWAQYQQSLVIQDASPSEAGYGPFDEEFDRLIIKSMEHFKVPGISIAIVNGSVAHEKAYGFAQLPFIPATPSTLYYTGSTTKSFAAAAILKLVENTADSSDPFKLSTPISDLINFILPNNYASRHATLEDLLSHRTGMPGHDFSYFQPNLTLSDLVHNLRNLPMTSEIRQRFQYCNMMYSTLSYAIETVTGSWLGTTFRRWFWEPLGMYRTFLSLRDAQDAVGHDTQDQIAVGYTWDNRTQQYVVEEYPETEIISGAGAVISTVRDYALYLRALIDKDQRILSEASYNELRTPRIFVDVKSGSENQFSFVSYGLGWKSSVYCDHIVYEHNGGINGFGTLMMYIPKMEAAIVMMSNSMYSGNAAHAVIGTEWMQRLFEVPADERADRFPELDMRLQSTADWLLHAAQNLYPDAPSEPGDKILPSLPLAEYAGSYYNKAYGRITLALAKTADI